MHLIPHIQHNNLGVAPVKKKYHVRGKETQLYQRTDSNRPFSSPIPDATCALTHVLISNTPNNITHFAVL